MFYYDAVSPFRLILFKETIKAD